MVGQLPPLGAGLPPFDPNNPLEAILQLQAMGIPIPPMPGLDAPPPPQAGGGGHHHPGQAPPRRRQRCRDFDEKGYCARGNSCMFQHGADTGYVPPPPMPVVPGGLSALAEGTYIC
jgi:hypothetical protein